MSCTVEQIAEKRRIALERLKQRKLNANNTGPSAEQSKSTEALVTKPVSSFYGNSTKASENNENNKKNTSIYKTMQTNTSRNNAREISAPYRSSSRVKMAPVFTKIVTCTCSLIRDDRFEVVTSGYHAKLVEVFKSIPSRSYCNDKKIWSFSLSDHELVLERVSLLNPDVVIGSLPKFVLNLMRSDRKKIDLMCLQVIEPKLSSQLLDFQKVGVAFGISNGGRCLIADDMGLGKTYQAIAIADFYKNDWPLLICTTATARDGWERHIRSLLPWVPSDSISCLTSGEDHFANCNVLITSYSLMDKYCNRLLEKKFNFIILDESHTIKNFKTKTTSSACRLGEKAKRILLLTGTPALSRPAELYSQLNIIDKKFFGSFKEYGLRYCAGKQTKFGFDSSGQSNLQELNIILQRKFMIRRTKEDVEFELGSKSRETVILDSSEVWNASDKRTQEAAENMQVYSSDLVKLKGAQRDEILLRFYSETAALKANAVCAYIKTVIRENIKFIVFAYHKVMLNAVSSCLIKQNVNFIRIDGTTKTDLRSKYIDRFQTEKSCRVALLSLKACNAAITLTSASLVLFTELDWNPSTLAQCESRAHRIGQKSPVICRYLLAKGTADDYIWKMLKAKQNVLNKAGIFSEDLSDATESSKLLGGNTLTQYFQVTPKKIKTDVQETTIVEDQHVKEFKTEPAQADEIDLKRLLDDEDETFLELDY